MPVDTDIALLAGRLHVPNPRDYRDAFIGATALRHQLTMVTRNSADFADFGLRLINPWIRADSPWPDQ